eukprot:8243319-Pyramimonas_sp.AAC.2
MASVLPGVKVQIDSTSLNEASLKQHIHFQAANGARKELASVYNFASFYLASLFGGLPRIIYLDTDVIVQGDVLELATLDLMGNPIAAVEDCSQ